MKDPHRLFPRGLGFALLLLLAVSNLGAQQTATGTLRGQIKDEFGGVIVGATVSVVDAAGRDKNTTTDADGSFTMTGLAPGTYIVRVVAPGFAFYENTEVAVAAGRNEPLAIALGVSLEKEEVTVAADSGISTASESNADAIVLRDKDIAALPEDPEDLAAALSALAGPSAGPNGGQIYVDGFTGGRLPPKESIREVRISQNPLNAENDRPGFGRVDILTRPGMDRFRGSANTSFADEAFNSRNPFSPTRADYQSRIYGFSLSGPVVAKKASFFVDFQRRAEDDNDVITATLLDPATLAPTSFNQAVLTPRRFTTISPRFDYAFNQNNTLVARYSYTKSSNLGGIGGFNLLSRAVEFASEDHNLQLTETAVLNASTINETRFQYSHARREQTGDNGAPTIQALDAFTGGGASVGLSSYTENRWELQNYTTHTRGAHTLRFGARLRGVKLTDIADSNFNGTFTFTSLAEYSSAIQGSGAVPAQFTISGGDPEARVSQYDFGGFIQDEWKLRPNLSVTLGLRYENQSNISSHFNLAPRVFFAWAPGGATTGSMFGGGNQPKFVIRGGFGMFYDRFNENGALQAIRFGELGQQRYTITNRTPQERDILDNAIFTPTGVSNVPTVAQLSSFLVPRALTVVDDNLQAPRTLLSAIQIERQLPKNWTVFGVFFNYRTQRVFRQRNINAFLPGTYNPDVAGSGVRPDRSRGDIYQYESTGRFNDYRLQVGVRNQLRPGFSLFANYNTGKATSDSDCVFGNLGGCFPADPYDLGGENGRVAFFARHQVFIGGNIAVPKLKLSINPFITARTGQFFNIITGSDRNGDGIFNDRPAFADAQTPAADLRVTRFGSFDIRPKAGQAIVPRNYGEGPGFFAINLGISRTFGFGSLPGRAAAAPTSGAAQGGGATVVRTAGGPGGPGGGPGGGGLSGGGGEKRYSLTFSLNIQNLLNRVNFATPNGNLSSPFFGEATRIVGSFGGFGGTAGGNRKIQASARFNF